MSRSPDSRSPARLNLDHLKKQAKELIRLYRQRDAQALARFRHALPAASGRSDDDIAALDLRLHDAQSCIARETGFASWTDLKHYVEVQTASRAGRGAHALRWLGLIYAGDITGTGNRANPRVALRMLAENPDLATDDPWQACAIGDEGAVQVAIAADPQWVNRPGGALNLPPLVAVTHSSLLRLPEFREDLHKCARVLLAAGADPNAWTGNRFPPASLAAPDDANPLSALYGAAGQNHDSELTAMLLAAGANPDDGESLYHALDNLDCTRLLLEHGARIAGSNAMYRVFDLDNVAVLKLLLAHGGDPNEPARNAPLTDWGSPLLWAIRRRRSHQHIAALLDAGADPSATTPDGLNAYRLALQFGLADVAALLRERNLAQPLSDEEQFVAACARGDEAEALRLRAARPDLPGALTKAQLRLLPDMVADGGDVGARLMIRLGWPIETRGGDWKASALNHAVMRGDASLTRFCLAHGADWTTPHGHGDNACGTLSWASRNEPVASGDWAGCAKALLDHGMPRAAPDPDHPDRVLIGGVSRPFSEEVTEVLLGHHPDTAHDGAG